MEENQDKLLDVHVQAGRPAHVWVRLEDGSTFILDQVDNCVPDRLIDHAWIGRATFRLPRSAPLGYHSLFLESDDQSWESTFIVTPAWAGTHGLGAGSAWGFMAQLYSVCSESSWGVGDFSDLADLAVWAATRHGADFLLINPTHAAEVVEPMQPSPYLPSTRRYINPIYIRPDAIEEYASGSEAIREQVQMCRHQAYDVAMSNPEISRDGVWRLKKEALRAIFLLGRRPSRQMDLDAYIAGEGQALARYATWCALTEALGQEWSHWPADYQNPDSAAVEEFRSRNTENVTFYMWLQWIASAQARAAQATAIHAGMTIGVMSDLAVGVNPEGQETWAMPDVFAHGVTVGAPPDAYNQAGQDWSQPPWRPDRLREAAYGPLRDMLSAILTQSGALRVDHIMGLFRLWWIPQGMAPDQGAYIRYDHEAMVGILALEAHRARAVVIGEDLGTVEPWVRDYLAHRGILGTSILWFEHTPDGHPLSPDHWRTLSLASVTTHDLPPTLGYLTHAHVDLRYRLGLLTEPLHEEIARDAADQAAMLHQLSARGLIKAGESDDHRILLGLHRFLYQSAAKLKCVALTDAVGDKRIQNQPGTIDQYPNWRIPLSDGSGGRLSLEQIYDMTSVDQVTDILNGRV